MSRGARISRRVWLWGRILGPAMLLAVLVWRLGTGPFVAGVRTIDGGALAVTHADVIGPELPLARRFKNARSWATAPTGVLAPELWLRFDPRAPSAAPAVSGPWVPAEAPDPTANDAVPALEISRVVPLVPAAPVPTDAAAPPSPLSATSNTASAASATDMRRDHRPRDIPHPFVRFILPDRAATRRFSPLARAQVKRTTVSAQTLPAVP